HRREVVERGFSVIAPVAGGRGVTRNKEARKVNSQSRRRFRSGALLSVTLLLTAALWLPAASTATAATPTTFSGQATALKGNVLGVGPLVTVDCNDASAKSSTICLAATQSFSGATEINDSASVFCY